MTPYLRAANVKDGELDLSDVKEMNFDPGERQIFRLQPGDVLVSEGAGSLAAVGTSAVYEGDPPGVCFQNTLLRLRPRADTDPRFVAWWARAMYASGEFARFATGASIYHLGAERVRAMRAWIPAIDEQRRIAAFLDAETERVAQLIAAKTRMIEVALEARDRTLDGRALPGFDPCRRLDPADLPLEGEVPAGWSSPPLGTLLDRITYGFTNPMPTVDDGPYMITANDVADGSIEFDAARRTSESAFQQELTDKSRPQAGDVLLTKDGTLGRVAISRGERMCVNQSVAVLTPDRTLIEPELLVELLRVPAYRDALIFNAGGTTIKHLYITRVVKQRLALPPRSSHGDLRRSLGETNDQFARLVSTIGLTIDKLQERRRSLITAAVTGEMEVP